MPRGLLKENSHQILNLAERKIQGPISSCMKLTVQSATEAENGPLVVQTIPRITVLLYSLLEVNTLGLTMPSAPNAPKMQRDMIYELHGCTNTVATCVVLYAILLT